jgi:predicted  nucleic acid-binding Zn-ribbon protein
MRRERSVICPHCRTENSRRSKRRGANDAMRGWLGIRPWRCRTCGERFYAWSVPVSLVVFAHCPRCGNLRLQRVSRDHAGHGLRLAVAKVLRIPAFRCDPCRLKFFSLRPMIKVLPTEKSAHVSNTSENVTQ